MILVLSDSGHRVPEHFHASAGVTRGTVDITLAGFPTDARSGQVLPGTVRMRSSGMTAILDYVADDSATLAVVILHDNSAGTWHGAGLASVVETCAWRPNLAASRCNAEDDERHNSRSYYNSNPAWQHEFQAGGSGRIVLAPHPGQRWLASSSSGGADIWAGVFVFHPGDDPLVVVTSGYAGRSGWTVRTVWPDGQLETATRGEWLAARRPAETLT